MILFLVAFVLLLISSLLWAFQIQLILAIGGTKHAGCTVPMRTQCADVKFHVSRYETPTVGLVAKKALRPALR
jgi:hypothetical protein